MNETTASIGQILASELRSFTWSKSRSSLLRNTTQGWQAITVQVLRTSTTAVIKLAAHAQLRVDEIEAIYLPYHPFVTGKTSKLHPTLTANCDGLLGDRSLANGFPADSRSINEFALSYAAELRKSVLPWLEKYSEEDALLAGLSEKDPEKWVTSDRLVKYPVVMAIYAKRKDWDGFDRSSAEFTAYCEQRHALVYKPVAEAMARMRGVH